MLLFKNKFFKATFILVLSGMSTKLLGLLIKIIYMRILPRESIGLYSLVMPTYSLLLNIATFSITTTISKLIAENEDLRIMNSASVIILVINLGIVAVMFVLNPFIAKYLLHIKETVYLLNACVLTLPFASLACILKGYYYGKQKMGPHAISNTVEQLIRLCLIIFVLPLFIKKSYIHGAVFLICTSLLTEFSSIITFIICMNKDDLIKIKKVYYNKDDYNKIMNLSLPLLSTKIINNIAYFFEPIVLTNVLLKKGYLNSFIVTEYGAYNAYAIATLAIPSFFITAIDSSLLPELIKEKNNQFVFKKRCKQALIITLVIGLTSSLIITIFRDYILMFLYHNTSGSYYIKILGPFFTLFYFEGLLSTILQAKGYLKSILLITIISSISKVLFTIALCFIFNGLNGLIYSEIINIMIVIVLSSYIILKKKKINYVKFN